MSVFTLVTGSVSQKCWKGTEVGVGEGRTVYAITKNKPWPGVFWCNRTNIVKVKERYKI